MPPNRPNPIASIDWLPVASNLAERDERPLAVIDGHGNVRIANRALRQVLGWRRAHGTEPWQRAFGAVGPTRAAERCFARARKGSATRCELVGRRADGSKLAFLLALAPAGRPPAAVVATVLATVPTSAGEAQLLLEGAADGTTVSDATVSALIRAKIDRLAVRASLSRRERDVLQLLLLGRNQREMAVLLGIRVRTVRFHQTNLLEKLGADSRADLIRLIV